MAEAEAQSDRVDRRRGPIETFTVSVRLFAWVAESAGAREVEIELRRGARASTAISRTLKAAGLDETYGLTDSVRLAVNREYVKGAHVIEPGDELALIPPVSGGAPAHVRITDERLSVDALHDLVTTDATGAVVIFSGTTRDVELLTYEVYQEMAQAKIEQIAARLLESYRIEEVAIEHRVGDVPRREPSVIVAVSARHRPAAFAAAREGIDRVKAEAPIWKLEVEAGFRSWVRGTVPNQ